MKIQSVINKNSKSTHGHNFSKNFLKNMYDGQEVISLSNEKDREIGLFKKFHMKNTIII